MNDLARYEIHENFLPEEHFKELENVIMDLDFPWRRRVRMVEGMEEGSSIYFTHCFYNFMNSMSTVYEPFIIPILNKLNATAPIQVRANMFIGKLFEKSAWHFDYPNIENYKTAIFYLNDCDGGTELETGAEPTFIKGEANKMFIMNNSIRHRAVTSKEIPIRFIINFNYF